MRRLTLPLLCLLAATACAHDPYRHGGYDPGGYNYEGDEWSGRDMDDLFRLDPWLEDTREGHEIVARGLGGNAHPEAVRDFNIRFRHFADADGDRRLTDREIRVALVRCATSGWR
ncbi:MAG TPA: hypothetical protein VGB54_04400 [Allosphingosinicella sp.]